MAEIGLMLSKMAKEQDIPLWIIEKDYALSYVLAGIATTPGFGDRMALKGGTALRKIYFPDYRFSEDLDFSTLEIGVALDFHDRMDHAVQQTQDFLQERGFFQVQHESLLLREPHPGGQVAYTLRVMFPYHRQPLCRLKVEIGIDEPVLQPPENRRIFHEYPESFLGAVQVYSLVEILAEKLRALLQSLARLHDRGWGASRVCRDYYDIWQMLNRANFENVNIADLTVQKCAIKDIDPPTVEDFFHPRLVESARREWNQMLVPYVADSPQPDRVIEEAQQALRQLW